MHSCTEETRLESIFNRCNLQILQQHCSITGLDCVEETAASAQEHLGEKINTAFTKAIYNLSCKNQKTNLICLMYSYVSQGQQCNGGHHASQQQHSKSNGINYLKSRYLDGRRTLVFWRNPIASQKSHANTGSYVNVGGCCEAAASTAPTLNS